MANNDEYIIPIGIDSSPSIKGLDDMIGKLEDAKDASVSAGKAMTDSLTKPTAAAEKMEQGLDDVNKKLDEVTDTSNKLGKELASSLNISNAAKGFTNNINTIKKQLTDITEKKKIGFEVDPEAVKGLTAARDALRENFDEIKQTLSGASEQLKRNIDSSKNSISTLTEDVKKLQAEFEATAPGVSNMDISSELAAAQRALVEENAALADYQAQLKEVDRANSDLVNTLAQANAAIDANAQSVVGINSSFEQVYGDLQPLTTRLGELEDRMYELALAGQTNTDEFKQLQAEAIRYRQTIQQVDAAVDTFAKRSAILDITVEAVSGLTGAFAAAQGAAALFGEENEAVEQALLKVNAAMSILQGVQAVAAVLNKDSAISALLLRNNLIGQTTATTATTAATNAQTAATGKATIATRIFSGALKAMGIGLIIGLIAFLVENWDSLTAAVNKFLPAGTSASKIFDSIKSFAMGAGNAIIQYLITPFNALTKLLQGDFQGFKDAIVKGFSFKKNFQDGFNAQELRNERAHQIELEKTRIEADARDLQRRKNRGENVEKEEIALQKRRIAIAEAGTKEAKEAQTTLEDMEDAAYKSRQDKAKEAAKKALEAAKKAAEERKEFEKKNNEAILAFNRSYEDSKLSVMKEGIDKRRKEIELEFNRQIEDLKKETELNATALVERNKLIAQLEAQKNAELVKVTIEYNKEVMELTLSAERQRLDLAKENRTNALALFDLETKQLRLEIEERYKDQAELRKTLEAALEENVSRERARINREYTAKELEEAEKKEILLVELSSKYGIQNEKTERLKQIALLNVRLDYAKKTLQALTDSGEAENSLLVLQAQKTISDLQKEIKEETEKNKGEFSWFEFLGLGDLSDKDQQAVIKAFSQFKSAVSEITDFIIDQYDRQIDKKQEVIDSLNDDISDLEKNLDKEKALQEKGLANNVEAVEKELALKQEQLDEEVRQQQELMEKKQAMQKAQMAIDTVVQAVNLATAATEIFKSLAGIPFIGVPLAIAAVGAMIGAFAVSRVKMAQAINAQSFGEGGWIDGKPHSQGGVKYRSEDGKNIELEGNEYVVSAKAMRKYGDVIEAANEDDLGGLGAFNHALQLMLKETGVSMFSERQEEALKNAITVTNNTKVYVNNTREVQKLEEISRHLAYLAQNERESESRWEDDLFFYIKRGSKTTRIKKENAAI